MNKSNTPKDFAPENQTPRETGKDDAPEKQRPTRCAIYTRVSTDQQAEVEYNSCEAQEDRIRSFIASQEGFVVFKAYTDPGFSGANTDRPGLKLLLADIAAGLLDMVVTYKIDRLTRSPRDFYQLIEHFDVHHVGFISVTERFDTSTPSGRLLRNIMLTFAQFERELISERVRDKVIQRVKRGLHVGGCPAFGYKSERGVLVLDPPRDQHVRFVYETYIKTRSVRAVLRAMKEKGIASRKGKPFCDSAVWNMLRNPVYAGKIVHKGKVNPGRHPAIVSEDLFAHVQNLVVEAPGRPPNPDNHLPFAGRILCRECGSTMSVAFTNKGNKGGFRKYFYYRCGSVGHRGKVACSTRQIGAERLHDLVYKNLLRISMDSEYLKNLVFSLQNRTRRDPEVRFEPTQDFYNLKPEILQKDLQAFIKSCARKTGQEKVVAVRKGIGRIHYSKTSVRVDYAFGAFSGAGDGGRRVDVGDRMGSVSDDVDGPRAGATPAARSAANQTPSTTLAGSFERDGINRPGIHSASGPRKRPNDLKSLSPSTPDGDFRNGGGSEI